MNKTQEFIKVNEDHWECLCGNDTMDIGFFPCDNKGDCKEPDSILGRFIFLPKMWSYY